MSNTSIYVGMDLAINAGIALYYPDFNKAIVFNCNQREPVDQFEKVMTKIQDIADAVESGSDLSDGFLFCLEEPHHLRNVVTARSLIERYGFFKYALILGQAKVVEVNLNSSRAWLGAKGKQDVLMRFVPHFKGSMLTSDHTDALLCALYQSHLDGHVMDWLSFAINDERGLSLQKSRELLPEKQVVL